MECAQLAAAFLSRKLACGKLSRQRQSRLIHELFYAITSPSQQAGWGKSGSKLHALQSFAPHFMSEATSLPPARPPAGKLYDRGGDFGQQAGWGKSGSPPRRAALQSFAPYATSGTTSPLTANPPSASHQPPDPSLFTLHPSEPPPTTYHLPPPPRRHCANFPFEDPVA